MKKHKYNIFPEANQDDFDRLVDDIKTNGYDSTQPVTLFEGDIIDGWNRQRACDLLGIEPEYTYFKGSVTEAFDLVMRTNKRRNLNPGQWACIAVEADEIRAEIAAAVEAERLRKQKANAANQYTKKDEPEEDHDEPALGQLIAPYPSKDDRKTVSKTAALFQTNRTYVNQAAKLKQSAPKTFEKVRSGMTTMTQANREIKEAKREERREENRAKVAEATTPAEIANVGAKFATIVIDPPWDWGDEGDQDQLGRARPDYATMTKQQLLDLPLPDLADDDCHIYLWITNRSLPKGFELLEKWGFRYVTALTWSKGSFGIDYLCQTCYNSHYAIQRQGDAEPESIREVSRTDEKGEQLSIQKTPQRLPSVQSSIFRTAQGKPLLLSELRCQVLRCSGTSPAVTEVGGETAELQGVDYTGGLQTHFSARPSDGEQGGICAGTQASDGDASESDLGAVGICSPQKQGPDGQSGRKSGGGFSRRTHESALGRKERMLSKLPTCVCCGCEAALMLPRLIPQIGMGNYFRGQTEHILFGVKGSQPLKRKDVGTLFNAPRGSGGHSSKPPEFYDLVESCSPGPYLEMFSRSEKDGWKTWGENA